MAQLSGPERRDLHEALLSAFPRLDQLEKLVSFGLDDNLQRIAGRDDLDVATRKVIEAAEATGQTSALLEAAIRQNPGNDQLAAVVERLRLSLDRSGPVGLEGLTRDVRVERSSAPFVRWLLLAGMIIALGGLGLVRPPATFELSLTLDRLSVQVDRWRQNDTQSLFESTQMPLQIAGFSTVELGAGLLLPGQSAAKGVLAPGQAVVTLVPSGPVPRVKFAVASLHSLNLGPGARLTLERREESPSRHSLWIAISESPEASGTVEVGEIVAIECAGCDAMTGADPQRRRLVGSWTFQSHGRHLARFRGKEPRITIWPEPGTVIEDADVDLRDNQRIAIVRVSDDRPQSAVIGKGSIGFASLQDTIAVAPGDFVELDGVRHASIKSLRVDTAIHVTMTGVAQSIRIGSDPTAMSQRLPMLVRHVVARK